MLDKKKLYNPDMEAFNFASMTYHTYAHYKKIRLKNLNVTTGYSYNPYQGHSKTIKDEANGDVTHEIDFSDRLDPKHTRGIQDAMNILSSKVTSLGEPIKIRHFFNAVPNDIFMREIQPNPDGSVNTRVAHGNIHYATYPLNPGILHIHNIDNMSPYHDALMSESGALGYQLFHNLYNPRGITNSFHSTDYPLEEGGLIDRSDVRNLLTSHNIADAHHLDNHLPIALSIIGRKLYLDHVHDFSTTNMPFTEENFGNYLHSLKPDYSSPTLKLLWEDLLQHYDNSRKISKRSPYNL